MNEIIFEVRDAVSVDFTRERCPNRKGTGPIVATASRELRDRIAGSGDPAYSISPFSRVA